MQDEEHDRWKVELHVDHGVEARPPPGSRGSHECRHSPIRRLSGLPDRTPRPGDRSRRPARHRRGHRSIPVLGEDLQDAVCDWSPGRRGCRPRIGVDARRLGHAPGPTPRDRRAGEHRPRRRPQLDPPGVAKLSIRPIRARQEQHAPAVPVLITEDRPLPGTQPLLGDWETRPRCCQGGAPRGTSAPRSSRARHHVNRSRAGRKPARTAQPDAELVGTASAPRGEPDGDGCKQLEVQGDRVDCAHGQPDVARAERWDRLGPPIDHHDTHCVSAWSRYATTNTVVDTMTSQSIRGRRAWVREHRT